MFQYATCCLFTIFNQIFLFVPSHSNTTFFYDLCLHPFSLPTHSLFLFHFPFTSPSTLSPIFFPHSDRKALFHCVQFIPPLAVWLGGMSILWLGRLLLWMWEPHHNDCGQPGPVSQDLPSPIWCVTNNSANFHKHQMFTYTYIL